MKAQWYDGIPPAEAVAAHETLHGHTVSYRPEIHVSDAENVSRYVASDPKLYGEWIIRHLKGGIEPYVSTSRLKVVEGRVYMQLGFTQWLLMDSVRWKNDIRCFPVGHDGLPLGFEKMVKALDRIVSDFETDYVVDGVVVDDPSNTHRMAWEVACKALNNE